MKEINYESFIQVSHSSKMHVEVSEFVSSFSLSDDKTTCGSSSVLLVGVLEVVGNG